MIYIIYSVSVRIFTTISRKSEKRGNVRMVLLKRRNIFELCAMKQWKRWLATVRGAKRMRVGGSPLLVAGRLPTDGYDAADSTFLAKIFSVIYTTALRR